MDPIYRVLRRDPVTGQVERIDKPRLLSPAEREQARREREEKRREVQERSARRHPRERPKNPPQEPGGRTDYFG